MEYGLLLDIIYIVSVSAAALFLCNRARIPAIVGFLFAGLLVGPAGLHVVHAVHEVDRLAEDGGHDGVFGLFVEPFPTAAEAPAPVSAGPVAGIQWPCHAHPAVPTRWRICSRFRRWVHVK